MPRISFLCDGDAFGSGQRPQDRLSHLDSCVFVCVCAKATSTSGSFTTVEFPQRQDWPHHRLRKRQGVTPCPKYKDLLFLMSLQIGMLIPPCPRVCFFSICSVMFKNNVVSSRMPPETWPQPQETGTQKIFRLPQSFVLILTSISQPTIWMSKFRALVNVI